MHNFYKKVLTFSLALSLVLNFLVVAEVFAQTACSTSAPDGASCTLSGGNWVPAADGKCVCPANSTDCDPNVDIITSCVNGGQWTAPTSAKCICPATGGSGGVGTGGGAAVSGGTGNCGDPNLVWDANAKLCFPKNQQCTSGSLACSSSLSALIIKVIDYLLFFAGIIAVVFIIIGGFWYITSAGNVEQAEKGKTALVNAIIGIVVVGLAFVIIRVISNTLNSGNVLGN